MVFQSLELTGLDICRLSNTGDEVTMEDRLFADLLASAEEMVKIERGEVMPDPKNIYEFPEIDVKAIRRATGVTQREFAEVIGVSYDLVKSWETNRRLPVGAQRKLLLLLIAEPNIFDLLKVLGNRKVGNHSSYDSKVE